MNKIPFKIRLYLGVGLMLLALVAALSMIISASYGARIWALITVPILAIVVFIIGFIFIPRTNEDGTPIALEKNTKSKKSIKKEKEPFISSKEWEELEEEDDEMIFIEENMEDK